MKRNENAKDDLLKESVPSASKQQAEAAGIRVLERLQIDSTAMPAHGLMSFNPSRRAPWRWMPAAAAAAAIVLAILVPARMLQSAPAVLEDANGSRKIQYGEIVRSSDDMNAMLAMAGGARVEMRSMSELSLERADDGVRIRLNNGGVIVNAAAQHAENLYVQTKDVMASVGGAVSLVKTEGDSSQVGAIGGEVRVLSGATEKKLRAGEQVSTNPGMESFIVKEDVSWSRQAESHVAMLQQAARPVVQAPPVVQVPKEERVVFEEATIRPAAPTQAPTGPQARGGGGAPGRTGCFLTGQAVQLDPRRLSIRDKSLHQLIAVAYGRCGDLVDFNRLSGGPAWIKLDGWDIEALIPEGSVNPLPTGFNGPAGELWEGRSPKVQKMLRTLLEERFGVTLRRETKKDVPVYLLTVAPGGPKFNSDDPRFKRPEPGSRGPVFVTRGVGPASSVTPNSNTTIGRQGLVTVAEGGEVNAAQLVMTCNGQPCGAAWFGNQTISQVIGTLAGFFAGRPILDRTGIADKVSFTLEWPRVPAPYVEGQPPVMPSFQDISKALEKVGLQLKEDPKGVLETFVIERAEKPSEN